MTAPGVRLVSSKVKAGDLTEAQLQQGLQSAANALSAVYAEARKSHPQLKGHVRGTFHIEADGTPRMFMEKGSEFTPIEGKSISDDFVGATFGGKWKFPKVGRDLLVTVDYEVGVGSAMVSIASDAELFRVWSAPAGSVHERAEAVNGFFTNGTPVSNIVAALGTNYKVLRPFSSVWVGPGPEPRKTCSLLYDFGNDTVVINTSADISGDPLTGEFTGAGSSLIITNSPTRIGQPDSATK